VDQSVRFKCIAMKPMESLGMKYRDLTIRKHNRTRVLEIGEPPSIVPISVREDHGTFLRALDQYAFCAIQRSFEDRVLLPTKGAS